MYIALDKTLSIDDRINVIFVLALKLSGFYCGFYEIKNSVSMTFSVT